MKEGKSGWKWMKMDECWYKRGWKKKKVKAEDSGWKLKRVDENQLVNPQISQSSFLWVSVHIAASQLPASGMQPHYISVPDWNSLCSDHYSHAHQLFSMPPIYHLVTIAYCWHCFTPLWNKWSPAYRLVSILWSRVLYTYTYNQYGTTSSLEPYWVR